MVTGVALLDLFIVASYTGRNGRTTGLATKCSRVDGEEASRGSGAAMSVLTAEKERVIRFVMYRRNLHTVRLGTRRKEPKQSRATTFVLGMEFGL